MHFLACMLGAKRGERMASVLALWQRRRQQIFMFPLDEGLCNAQDLRDLLLNMVANLREKKARDWMPS